MRIIALSYFTSMFHEENVQTKIMQNPDKRLMEETKVAMVVTNIPTHSTLPNLPLGTNSEHTVYFPLPKARNFIILTGTSSS